MTSTRPLGTLAGLALTALLTAGCSGTAGSPTSSTTTDAGPRAQGVKFAECMRDNGIRDFPDPDSAGRLTADGVANDAGVDTTTAAFKHAADTCRDLAPAGFTGEGRNADQQRQALAFAACIRDHGVPDFPDPAPDAALVDTNRIPSSDTARSMEALDAAMAACGDASAGLVDR